MFAAANRDEAEFAEASRVVLDAWAPRWRRMEARVMVKTLRERCGGLDLADGNNFACERSYLLHGLRALHLTVRPR